MVVKRKSATLYIHPLSSMLVFYLFSMFLKRLKILLHGLAVGGWLIIGHNCSFCNNIQTLLDYTCRL